MTVPEIDDVLCVQPDAVGEFIRQQAEGRTLSVLVKNLNHDLINGDAEARVMADRALTHLGLGSHP